MSPYRAGKFPSNDPDCIVLRVQAEGFEQVFALAGNDERVIAVGSANSADIRFEQPGVSPIHFYFERSNSDVWIVPAYCVSELRVNAAKVSSPRRLGKLSIIEFGKIRLTAETLGTIDPGPSVKLGSQPEARSANHLAYLSQLPENDAPTLQAWQPPESSDEAEPESSATTLIARNDPTDPPAHNPHDEYDTCSGAQMGNAIQLPLGALPRASIDAAGTRPAQAVSVDPPQVIDLLPLSKTLFGIAPPVPAITANGAPRHGGAKGPRHTNGTNPLQTVTLLDGPPIRGLRQARKGYLIRLGLLTKRYPIRVCVAAIAISLAASATVVLGAKYLMLRAHRGTVNPVKTERSSPAASVPTLERSGSVAREQDRHAPTLFIERSLPGAPATRKGSGRTEPADFAAAAQSLVQGHYAEAQAEYASLAARPGADPTDIQISQLLARRVSPPCSNTALSAQPVSCPEVIP